MTQREIFERQYLMADDGMLADAMIAATRTPLSEDARAALEGEIDRRGLRDRVDAMFRLMTAPQDPALALELAATIAARPCPHCGSSAEPLRAAEAWRAISVVAFTTRRPRVAIGCRACLDRRIRSASTTTMIAGWWALPWGPIRTLEVLRANRATRRELETEEWPGEMLLWYATTHGPRLMFEAGLDPDWRPAREVAFTG